MQWSLTRRPRAGMVEAFRGGGAQRLMSERSRGAKRVAANAPGRITHLHRHGNSPSSLPPPDSLDSVPHLSRPLPAARGIRPVTLPRTRAPLPGSSRAPTLPLPGQPRPCTAPTPTPVANLLTQPRSSQSPPFRGTNWPRPRTPPARVTAATRSLIG